MSKRKTHEQFVKEVFELVGEEFIVLENYINAKTKIRMKHNQCNFAWEIQPNAFLRGNRCPNCFGNIKKTIQWYKEEVYKLVRDEYKILGEYKGINEKTLMFHTECEKMFDMRPSHFLRRNHRCPHCSKLKQKTNDQFIKEIHDLTGNEFSVLSPYINNREKVLMKHNICGYAWKIRASAFVNDGNRCPNCAGNIKKTTEQFKQEVFNLVKDEYEVLGEYTLSGESIELKHSICESLFKTTPNKFSQGRRCPICNSSHGELLIRDFLSKMNISYKHQYYFEDCRNKHPLLFDFVVLDNKNQVKWLIEYDGIQHFQPVKHFGGENSFNYTRHNDSIKNKYCKTNDIPLIRIPYWEFDNIEEILHRELNNLSLIIN